MLMAIIIEENENADIIMMSVNENRINECHSVVCGVRVHFFIYLIYIFTACHDIILSAHLITTTTTTTRHCEKFYFIFL